MSRRPSRPPRAGAFLVVNLIPGRYQLDVELVGFKKSTQTLTLEVSQRGPHRRDAGDRIVRGERHRRRDDADPEHQRRHAGLGHPAGAGREPAAGHPQLGRPARARARRAGRPLHRAGRRHVVWPHGRRQRARHAVAAEQLPARRRGQQQHLDQRAGADDAGVAAVGGRDPGVQGRDQPVLGGIRPLAGRRRERLDQVGHEQLPRHGLRVLPQRVDGLDRLLLEARGLAEAGQQPEPVRRQPRRPDRQEQRVLLRRLRGHAHHASGVYAADPRADGRRAGGHLHLDRP